MIFDIENEFMILKGANIKISISEFEILNKISNFGFIVYGK